MFALFFSASCICNNDLLDFNRSVAESCCSTAFSCAFSWLWVNQCFLNFRFWFCQYCIWFAQCQQKSPWIVFLAFDLSVPSSDLERINIWFMALIPLALYSFPIWLAQFQQKAPYIVLLTRCRSLFFWPWVNHFCLICLHLLLVYHSAQLSHTWSDFSHSLRGTISETRILFHFILVLLSSTLMKQLTCNVGIISLICIFGLDI